MNFFCSDCQKCWTPNNEDELNINNEAHEVVCPICGTVWIMEDVRGKKQCQ